MFYKLIFSFTKILWTTYLFPILSKIGFTRNNVNRKHYLNTASLTKPSQIIYVYFNQGHLEIILYICLSCFTAQFLNAHPRTSAKVAVSESF